MLFGDRTQANLRACVKMVEAVLTELGHDALSARVHNPTAGPSAGWRFRKGSAEIAIIISMAGGEGFIRATSDVVILPKRDEDARRLMKRLLELNGDAVRGAAFGLRGDTVVLTAERPTLDLDPSEVSDLIRRVETWADQYDDELVVQHGASRRS